ncbi:hypothetical protein K4L44_08690 [Halosquirtibacter laminarini]|uniref:Uncharacterized protein n=1 Tax=Halosquirtibacter laminarini TaxID=3374600 RepID=A0AC61NJZ7_9BACT|nr:hypothetical protein K4L44_08690 [Prolixibacteraceae bacterium]
MDTLFSMWASKKPNYNKIYQDTLFKKLAFKMTGTEENKEMSGKLFVTNYELYIYAFFLGYYAKDKVPLQKDDEKINFSHEIKNWGKRGKSLDRKNYTIIQKYMFMALIATSDIDFIDLDNQDEKGITSAVTSLRQDMEAYANAGFIRLQDMYDENKSFLNDKVNYLNMILNFMPLPEE